MNMYEDDKKELVRIADTMGTMARTLVLMAASDPPPEVDSIGGSSSVGTSPVLQPTVNEAASGPLIPRLRNAKRLIPWGQQAIDRYGLEFIDGVAWIESQLGLKMEYLMACMKFESGLDHKARNPQSSASGLIQFMAATALQLGTTIEEIRSMDVMVQLSYVYKYFKQFESRGHDLSKWDIADTYMAILWPAGIGKPMDHPVFAANTSAYKVNRGLDANKDGFVTKAEAAAKVIKMLTDGLKPQNALEY